MIPKTIHYCWFGGGKKPKLAEKCIKSWKKYCPDYEITEWNESNFDLSSAPLYVRQAYEAKKWAFVADYVRLYCLYNNGGIYLDTDVELFKSFDAFLKHKAFSGFEGEKFITTGVMACEQGNALFKELLSFYDDIPFIKPDGSYNMTTNVEIITNLLNKRGVIFNGKYQEVLDYTLYPKDYFCPFNDATGVLSKTENTVAVHWFNKSWIDERIRIRSKITRPFHRIFGEDCFEKLKR